MGDGTEQSQGLKSDILINKWRNEPAKLLPSSLKMSLCPSRSFPTNFHNFIDF